MTNADSHDLRAENAADIAALRNFHDLPVPLTLELGRTELTVQALLELELQSIIQLQRSTAEGVDVVAGGHYIARGEIIMIEYRTGVRINEVVTSNRATQ